MLARAACTASASATRAAREAHIDIFEVNRRLRLIYLNGPDMPTSDSAVVDDFLLDVRKGRRHHLAALAGLGRSRGAELGSDLRAPAHGLGAVHGAHQGDARKSAAGAKSPSRVEPKDPPLPGLDY